jgi:hypothetical protein
MPKISKGGNDRPKNTGISPTDPAIPDAGSHPADVSDKDIEKTREKLLGEHGAADSTKKEREKDREPSDGDRR